MEDKRDNSGGQTARQSKDSTLGKEEASDVQEGGSSKEQWRWIAQAMRPTFRPMMSSAVHILKPTYTVLHAKLLAQMDVARLKKKRMISMPQVTPFHTFECESEELGSWCFESKGSRRGPEHLGFGQEEGSLTHPTDRKTSDRKDIIEVNHRPVYHRQHAPCAPSEARKQSRSRYEYKQRV